MQDYQIFFVNDKVPLKVSLPDKQLSIDFEAWLKGDVSKRSWLIYGTDPQAPIEHIIDFDKVVRLTITPQPQISQNSPAMAGRLLLQ